MKPIIVTITGPSSSGKTVLSRELSQNGFEPLISTTTRTPRKGEQDGRDYYFITPERFLEKLANNELIENVEYDGNYYGVTAKEAMRSFEAGKPAVLVAEPNGCQQIHQLCEERGWDVLRVFVNNPIPVLVDRMLRRFHEDTKALDLSTDEGAAELSSKVKAHGNRILKILDQEQKEWVKPAYDGTVKYDLLVDRFDGNQTEVVQQVKDIVRPYLEGPGVARKPKP